MKHIYALRIATQDRPKIFQFIVSGLFYLSVFTASVCSIYLLKEESKDTVQTHRPNNASLAQRPLTYAATPAVFREQKQ